jgi:hypothetical protein
MKKIARDANFPEETVVFSIWPGWNAFGESIFAKKKQGAARCGDC